MTLGGVTASNGIVDLLATGAASDITLGANITPVRVQDPFDPMG